jgi:tetratricopeptide (TPR) repeat protein
MRAFLPHRCFRSVVLGICLLNAGGTFAQDSDPKTAFIRALADFSLDLRGTFGDEGARLASHLQAMRAALEQWDAQIARYAAAMASERPGAAPALARQMHIALGAVYLDSGRTADALREFTAAAVVDPSSVDAQVFAAWAHERAGNTAAAGDAWIRAATLAPQIPSLAYEAARAHRAAKRPVAADDALRRVVQLIDVHLATETHPASPFNLPRLVVERSAVDPFFPPASYAKGYALLAAERYLAAVGAFADAVAKDPLAAPPGAETGPMRRAAAALRDGSVQTAIQQFTLATALEPERSEPHRLLAHALALDKQYERALESLAVARRLNAGDERIALQVADISVKTKNDADVIATLTKAIAASPASGRAVYELGLALQRNGRYPEAIERFHAALRFTPLLGANSIHQNIGSLHRSQQQFVEAAAAFEKRVALIPNDPQAHHELGEIYVRLGRDSEALAEFSVATLIDPKRVDSHVAIAQAHLREGRFEHAERVSRRVIALDEEHREARYILATSLIRIGRDDEGRKELAVFHRYQTEDAASRARIFELEGYKREATVSAATGDHAKAIALLRKVVAADPTQAGPHLDLGDALIEAKQLEEGVSELREASRLGAPFEVHRRLADALAILGDTAESERERARYEQFKQEELRRELQR